MGDRLGIRGALGTQLLPQARITRLYKPDSCFSKGEVLDRNKTSQEEISRRCLNDQATVLEITL